MLTIKSLAKFRKPLLLLSLLLCLSLTPTAYAKTDPTTGSQGQTNSSATANDSQGASGDTAQDKNNLGGGAAPQPKPDEQLGCGTASKSQAECLGNCTGGSNCQDGECSDPAGVNCVFAPDFSNCDLQCFLADDVEPVLKVLSALIVIVILANILWGGIQYMTADDRAEAGVSAKKRITRNIIALVLYLLIFAFSQFLIPGGIFNG